MANKLAFRARAPDASKPLPIYHVDEIPDLVDAAINRAVPPMPTGMEKNEECEHHLLKAISARQKYGDIGRTDSDIPIPDVLECVEEYVGIYTNDSTVTKNYIHVPPFSLEPSKPDYDLDSEDEEWFAELKKKDHTFEDFTATEFEEMIDRLEKGSGQNPASLREARRLLKQDDDLIMAVHAYWMDKRARYVASVEGKFDRNGVPLVAPTVYPLVLTSVPLGSAPNNPYVAFRKRTEKMQTRKNRKNDEFAYEKMVKLRRDLMRTITLLEMVKRREKLKREYINLTVEIVEKRYQLRDWKGEILNEVVKSKRSRSDGRGIRTKHSGLAPGGAGRKVISDATNRKRCKPDLDDVLVENGLKLPPVHVIRPRTPVQPSVVVPSAPKRRLESAFAFRARSGCRYAAPQAESDEVDNRPSFFDPLLDNTKGDARFQFHLASSRFPKDRQLGLIRRRLGRGGRIVLDRLVTSIDDGTTAAGCPLVVDQSPDVEANCDTCPGVAIPAVPGSQVAGKPAIHQPLTNSPHYTPVVNTRSSSSSPDVDSSDDEQDLPSTCILPCKDNGDDWGITASAADAREYLMPWSMTFGGPDSDADAEEGDEAHPVFAESTSVDFDTIALDGLEMDCDDVLTDEDDDDDDDVVGKAEPEYCATSCPVPDGGGAKCDSGTRDVAERTESPIGCAPPPVTVTVPVRRSSPTPHPTAAVVVSSPASVNSSTQQVRVQNCAPRVFVRGGGGAVIPLSLFSPPSSTIAAVKESPLCVGNGGSMPNSSAEPLILHKQLMRGRTDATTTSSPPHGATQIVFFQR